MNQSFNIIVNIITLGFGVYAIFTWFKLRDGLLFDNSLLIPKERTIAVRGRWLPAFSPSSAVLWDLSIPIWARFRIGRWPTAVSASWWSCWS